MRKVNIDLRDGTEILGKDTTPSQPNPYVFCFVSDEAGSVTFIPWDLIKEVSIYDEE